MLFEEIRWRGLLIAALVLVAGACIWYQDLLRAAITPNPLPPTPQSIARGQLLWLQTCAACHGTEGRGDGPAASALPKRPKDLTKIATPPVFPDGVLAYRIANGGAVLPAWKGTLSSEDLWQLVNFIRAQRRG
jgi:mono/diheme cytochrome c family protein